MEVGRGADRMAVIAPHADKSARRRQFFDASPRGRCRLEAAIVGLMESGNDVRAIPARPACLVNWQDATLSPASEPRKLFSSVRSRSKQISNGRALIMAQMASPLTRSVPGGSVA